MKDRERRMTEGLILIFLIFIFGFYTGKAFAHGGRTDQWGAHTNSSTGVYHCHSCPWDWVNFKGSFRQCNVFDGPDCVDGKATFTVTEGDQIYFLKMTPHPDIPTVYVFMGVEKVVEKWKPLTLLDYIEQAQARGAIQTEPIANGRELFEFLINRANGYEQATDTQEDQEELQN